MGKLGYIISEQYRRSDYEPPRSSASSAALIRQRMQIEGLNRCISETPEKMKLPMLEKMCAVGTMFSAIFVVSCLMMPLQTTKAMAVISDIIIPDFWLTRSLDAQDSGRFIVIDNDTRIRGTLD